MEVKYEKAKDVVTGQPSILLIGSPGTGKTTFLGQAAAHLMKERGGEFLIVNMEPADRVYPMQKLCPEATVLQNPEWDVIQQVFTADYRKFTAGIALDGLHWYTRKALYDIMGFKPAQRENIGKSFTPNQFHWTLFGERLRNHFFNYVQKDVPLIVTSLLKFDKDELTGEVFKSCSVFGKMAVDIPALFTVCGVSEYIKAPEGWEIKFRPERGFPARDTKGLLAPVEKLNFSKIWTKLQAGVEAPNT